MNKTPDISNNIDNEWNEYFVVSWCDDSVSTSTWFCHQSTHNNVSPLFFVSLFLILPWFLIHATDKYTTLLFNDSLALVNSSSFFTCLYLTRPAYLPIVLIHPNSSEQFSRCILYEEQETTISPFISAGSITLNEFSIRTLHRFHSIVSSHNIQPDSVSSSSVHLASSYISFQHPNRYVSPE